MRNEEEVKETISKRQCPICGEDLGKETLLITDSNFGEVLIHSKHTIKPNKKAK